MTSSALSPRRSRSCFRELTRDQAGFTLVEELVAMGLVAFGLVMLVAMLTTGSAGVTVLADHVTADSLARSQLEIIKDAPYEPNPLTNPYPGVSVPAPYSVSVEFEFWIAPNGPFTSSVRNDGLQLIRVTVVRDGNDILTLEDYKADR